MNFGKNSSINHVLKQTMCTSFFKIPKGAIKRFCTPGQAWVFLMNTNQGLCNIFCVFINNYNSTSLLMALLYFSSIEVLHYIGYEFAITWNIIIQIWALLLTTEKYHKNRWRKKSSNWLLYCRYIKPFCNNPMFMVSTSAIT